MVLDILEIICGGLKIDLIDFLGKIKNAHFNNDDIRRLREYYIKPLLKKAIKNLTTHSNVPTRWQGYVIYFNDQGDLQSVTQSNSGSKYEHLFLDLLIDHIKQNR